MNNFFGYLTCLLWVILSFVFQFKGQETRSDIFAVGAILLLYIVSNKKEGE